MSSYRYHMLKHDDAILTAHCADISSIFSVTTFAFIGSKTHGDNLHHDSREQMYCFQTNLQT